MIKCVVFDFDGVLVDSNAVKRKAYFDIFAPLSNTHKIVAACLTEEREGDRYQVIASILRRLRNIGLTWGNDALLDAVVRYAEQYNQICETYTANCREILGASACLKNLAKHYKLYVNSATPEEPLQRVIQQRGWEPYFQDVLGSPHTKIENLNKIMQKINVKSKEIVFVGDSQRDWTAAKTCGCYFVGVRNSDNDFASLDLVLLDDLYGLNKVISEQLGGDENRC